jgi:hypothetical protein
VPNPVEILMSARRRVALVEAARAACYAIAPAAVAAALALTVRPLGALTWERWGYLLAPDRAEMVELAMWAAAALATLIGLALAVRAWVRANDFILAAGEVDDSVGGHQQILTLATLADPTHPQPPSSERSPLFPLLWRSALGVLTGFDPQRAFPLALGRPLVRSSALGVMLGALMILATLGLVRPPTPLQATAARLRTLANEIASTATDSSDLALASEVRGFADSLSNPNLPPEKKIEQLQQVMKEVERHQKEHQQEGSGAQASKSSGSGGSSPSPESKGESKGKGQGKGTGAGSAEGSSNSGKGGGKSQQGKTGNNKKKREGQSIELQNELAKAQAQVETANATNPSPADKSGQQEAKSAAPKPGTTPNQQGAGAQPNPNQPGNIPQQGAAGQKNIPQPGDNRKAGQDKGSNQGDTRLGEFPAPAKFQRYLKPGEKGELNIRDARYVMFRLPSATPVGAGGTSVIDKGRPKATTAYVNAPLKETGADAPPDERQMIPPRYRELIH